MKKKQFDPFKNLKLDPYEQEIEDSLERGEWKSVGNIKKIRQEMANEARYTLDKMKKDRRVSIRVNGQDLEAIQVKAAKNRLPYQTLISTVLHHFAKGNIKIEL